MSKFNIKMKSKILTTILAFSFILGTSVPAFADYEQESQEPQVFTHQVGAVMRGTNIPTEEWDLSDGSYNGSFSGVQYGLYTNYYFVGETSLMVDVWGVTKDSASSSDVKLHVYLYDVTTRMTRESIDTGVLSETEDSEKVMFFYNLLEDHKYCLYMVSSDRDIGISGNVEVGSNS